MGKSLNPEKIKTMPDNYLKLEGKWLQVKADNVEKCLEAQGMSWTKRKIASKLTPTIVFTFPEENKINIAFSTTVMTRSQTYTIKGKTNHKDYEDNDVESEAEVDADGNWIMVTRGQKCGPIKTSRIVDGNKLTLTTAIVEKNVSCVRHFERQ